MALDIEIDRDACMGSGQCMFAVPDTFDLDDDGIAVVLDPAGAPEDEIVGAGRRCPAQAITVRRSGETLAP